MSTERLSAVCTNNGTLVHLADRSRGRTICGYRSDLNPVRARITCKCCARKRPAAAARRAQLPLVKGINWEPTYRAFQRALASGATEPPRIKVKYWPVLA